MQYIQHRVNQTSQLKEVGLDCGVEIDLRSDLREPGSIHLSHDVWKAGDDFRLWLSEYKRLGIKGPILLNTKEDGLEEATFALMQEFQISNFLFLDTALPTLVRFIEKGLGNKFFVRLSCYEPSSFVETFKGKVDWVWVDCFKGNPLDAKSVQGLRSHFKMCLVSPELQHRDISEIIRFKELAHAMDAICTKNVTAWRELLK